MLNTTWIGLNAFLKKNEITLEAYKQASLEGKSWCCKCKIFLPDISFNKVNTKFHRKIQTSCRVCANANDETQARKNYKAAYYQKNLEAIREKHRIYARKNRARLVERVKIFRASLAPEELQRIRRNERLKEKYGLTINDYNKILLSQNTGCAICGKKPEENKGGVLFVDHNHKCCNSKRTCGKCIRGLLCNLCNNFIGFLENHPEKLDVIKNYLEKYK